MVVSAIIGVSRIHVKYCDFVLHRHDVIVLAKICPRTHRQTDKHLAINSKSLQKVSLGLHLTLMTHTHKLKTLLSQLVQYVPSFFYLLSKQMHVLTRSLPVLFTGGTRIDKSWFLVAAFKKQMFLMLGEITVNNMLEINRTLTFYQLFS